MTWDFRPILSGERRGPLAVSLRGGLRAGSWAYGAGVRLRNRRYDSGATQPQHCGAAVISVGNLTTGGTGKTPVVAHLAQWFQARGAAVAIVSRGYGSGDQQYNDEALELQSRLPGVPHVQNPNRVAAAREVVQRDGAEVVLMDDGFQHRRLHRDLDLVVIDATCPFGYGALLPRGLLREPVENLGRADLVLLSRCDAVEPQRLVEIEQRIRSVAPRMPIVRTEHRPAKLLVHPDRQEPLENLVEKSVAVLSAIGNPAAFVETVQRCGAGVVASRFLPDHDPYRPETVRQIETWLRSLGDLDRVLCTHKDLVKLRTDQLAGRPLAAVTIELALTSDSAPLDSALQSLLETTASLCSSAATR